MKHLLACGALAFALFSAVPAQAQLITHATTGQVKIAITGTAVNLPNADLLNGIIVKAKSANNAACGLIGPASVTNAVDGTGNGYIICPGEASSFAVPNTKFLWVNGTAGDIFTFEGN